MPRAGRPGNPQQSRRSAWAEAESPEIAAFLQTPQDRPAIRPERGRPGSRAGSGRWSLGCTGRGRESRTPGSAVKGSHKSAICREPGGNGGSFGTRGHGAKLTVNTNNQSARLIKRLAPEKHGGGGQRGWPAAGDRWRLGGGREGGGGPRDPERGRGGVCRVEEEKRQGPRAGEVGESCPRPRAGGGGRVPQPRVPRPGPGNVGGGECAGREAGGPGVGRAGLTQVHRGAWPPSGAQRRPRR